MDWADAARAHPDRTLLLVWPPMHETTVEALTAYSGERFVYVGEPQGGCTGDEAFFEQLSRDWDLVTMRSIPQWSGINDLMEVYKRRAR